MPTVEELQRKLDYMIDINARMGIALEREVNARMNRHAAKRVISKITKAAKRLARPRPEKYVNNVHGQRAITTAWKEDRASRKQARKVLRAAGGIVGTK